jgi:hypothetical protein
VPTVPPAVIVIRRQTRACGFQKNIPAAHGENRTRGCDRTFQVHHARTRNGPDDSARATAHDGHARRQIGGATDHKAGSARGKSACGCECTNFHGDACLVVHNPRSLQDAKAQHLHERPARIHVGWHSRSRHIQQSTLPYDRGCGCPGAPNEEEGEAAVKLTEPVQVPELLRLTVPVALWGSLR